MYKLARTSHIIGLVSRGTNFTIHNTRRISYYDIFSKTLKKSNDDKWNINLNQLRKEYRLLQSQSHPDMVNHNQSESSEIDSSLLNKAYNTLKTPLLRAQYLISLETGKNLNEDAEVQELKKTSMAPETLMEVMMVHEQLEDATTEDEVKQLRLENKQRMEEIEIELGKCFTETKDMNKAIKLCLNLKYWSNLEAAFKEWEPNTTITLKH